MLSFALQTMIMNKNKDSNLCVVTWASPAASGISKIWWNLITGFLKWLVTKTHWQCIKMIEILQSSVSPPNFKFSVLILATQIPFAAPVIYLLVYGIPLSNYVFSKASDAFPVFFVQNPCFPELQVYNECSGFIIIIWKLLWCLKAHTDGTNQSFQI